MYGITHEDLTQIAEAPDVSALESLAVTKIPFIEPSAETRFFHVAKAHLATAKELLVGCVHAERLAEQGLAPRPQWRQLLVMDMTKINWVVEAVGAETAGRINQLTTTDRDMIFNATKYGVGARGHLMWSMQENDKRRHRLGELGMGATLTTLHEITHSFDPEAEFLAAEHAARQDEAVASMGAYSGTVYEAWAESGKMVFGYGERAPRFAKDAWALKFPMTAAMWSASTRAADNLQGSVHRLHSLVDRDGHPLSQEAARQKHFFMAGLQKLDGIGRTPVRPVVLNARPGSERVSAPKMRLPAHPGQQAQRGSTKVQR